MGGPRNQEKPKNWSQAKYKDPKKLRFLKEQNIEDVHNVDVILYEMFGIWEDGVNLIYDEPLKDADGAQEAESEEPPIADFQSGSDQGGDDSEPPEENYEEE